MTYNNKKDLNFCLTTPIKCKLKNRAHFLTVFVCWSSGCQINQCAAHTKCPPGKYTKTRGSVTAQPKCEACAPGFFKATTSNSSNQTDACTVQQSLCPLGTSTTVTGSTSPQRKCKACKIGFFTPIMSKNSTCDHGRCLAIMIYETIT